MKSLIIKFQFDGTNYHGWQIQPNVPTIQEEIQNAFAKIVKQDINFMASGRTDSGVHAQEQIAAAFIEDFSLPEDKITQAINPVLPDDIYIIDAQIVNEEFNPRFDAIAREYSYNITTKRDIFSRHYKLFINESLDLKKMNEASEMIVGEYDFTTFSKVNVELNNYNCNVMKCKWVREDENNIKFEIKSNRFVYAMVRSIVGTMIDIGKGKLDAKYIETALLSRDRSLCSQLAPPHALFFEKVYYENSFKILRRFSD